MEKRGQVTVFIVLGIAILAALSLLYFLFFSSRPISVSPDQFPEVQEYVEGCARQTLRDGISYLGEGPNPNYEQALASYIKENIVYCLKFDADLPEYVVRPGDIGSVSVSFNDDRSVLTSTLVFPIAVTRGSVTKNLDRFHAEFPIVERGCANVDVDSSCNYQGSVPASVVVAGINFTFNTGDYVGVGSTCIACR